MLGKRHTNSCGGSLIWTSNNFWDSWHRKKNVSNDNVRQDGGCLSQSSLPSNTLMLLKGNVHKRPKRMATLWWMSSSISGLMTCLINYQLAMISASKCGQRIDNARLDLDGDGHCTFVPGKWALGRRRNCSFFPSPTFFLSVFRLWWFVSVFSVFCSVLFTSCRGCCWGRMQASFSTSSFAVFDVFCVCVVYKVHFLLPPPTNDPVEPKPSNASLHTLSVLNPLSALAFLEPKLVVIARFISPTLISTFLCFIFGWIGQKIWSDDLSSMTSDMVLLAD